MKKKKKKTSEAELNQNQNRVLLEEKKRGILRPVVLS
jgi:hypothetical protein